MRFALVNGQKIEPQPKLRGSCPSCQGEMIARCGKVKVWHWAHKGKPPCDPWWETETEWHRAWKDNFPKEWQEIYLVNKADGTKHIADVRTDKGLVVEFQHSYLNPEEREIREQFYRKMVWVADGTRRQRDYPRFIKASEGFWQTHKKGLFLVPWAEGCFPKDWLESKVPVFFDFKDGTLSEQQEWVHESLWCLLPVSVDEKAVVVVFAREAFVELASKDMIFQQLKQAYKDASDFIIDRAKRRRLQLQAMNRNQRSRPRPRSTGRRRRYRRF